MIREFFFQWGKLILFNLGTEARPCPFFWKFFCWSARPGPIFCRFFYWPGLFFYLLLCWPCLFFSCSSIYKILRGYLDSFYKMEYRSSNDHHDHNEIQQIFRSRHLFVMEIVTRTFLEFPNTFLSFWPWLGRLATNF